MPDPPDPFDGAEFAAEQPDWELLASVADPISRYTLAYLRREGSATLDTIATVVTGWTNASTGQIATTADRDRVRTALYHVHLPKLAAVGLVEFDPVAKTASMREPSPSTRAFLDWVQEHSEPGGYGGPR